MLDRRPNLGLLVLTSLSIALGCAPVPGQEGGGVAGEGRDGPPNVILICHDTVRADHLGCYGYERDTTPFLDELAARGMRFADTSATASWTKPSVPSFLTGTFPCQHGVYEGSSRFETGRITDVLPDKSVTLAEVFQERGYRTGAFVHNAQLRYGNGFEQGFDLYAQENWDARELRWRGVDWLDQGGDEPFFLYLHFLDAHWPYPAPDSYATRFAGKETVAPFRGRESKALRSALNSGEIEMTEAHREALIALYDGSLRYIDDSLRALDDALALRGLDDNTIVCVVSDHGEEFGEHGYIGHGNGLYQGLLSVPWILYVPGEEPRVVEQPVSLVDLFPTLVSAAGLETEHKLPGVDRMADPDRSLPILAEHKNSGMYMHAMRQEQSKLLRTMRGPKREVQGLSPLGVGQRWEAEVEIGEDGEFRALELKPSEDDPDDPLEIKGHVEDPQAESFRLGTVLISFNESTRRQFADDVRDGQLTPGRLVKVKGYIDGGVFAAERIKVYKRGEENDLEIRGRIEELEEKNQAGRMRIGDLWVHFDRETEMRGGFERPKVKRVLSRGEIVSLLEGGAESLGQLNIERTVHRIDLREDPLETASVEVEGDAREGLLDALLLNLVKNRVFEASDRILLTPEAVQALRDIGYAE